MPTPGITYELALRLKEAGFPQPELTNENSYRYLCESISSCVKKCYCPTLEELIAACGKKFGNLALKNWNPKGNNQWIAEPAYDISMEVNEGAGFTPSLAVANLWLSLK